MMSGDNNLQGITACIDNIVARYNEATAILEKVKTLRAEKQAPPPSRYLEETLQCSSQDISREKERGVGRFGIAFEQGDDAALKSLREIGHQLEEKLVHELRRLVQSEDLAEFGHLVDEADSGRDHTIDTLIRLRQRCLANESHDSRTSSENSIPQVHKELSSPTESTTKTYHFPHHHNPWLRLHRNHSTVKAESRDVSGGEEDSTAGAENHHKKHHGHHGSLLNFLKHHRTQSHYEKPEPVEDHRLSRASTSPMNASMVSRAGSVISLESTGTQDSAQPWWQNGYAEKGFPSLQRQSSELSHRDSHASVDTVVPISPTAHSYRSRTASNATSLFRTQSLALPTPTQDNDYLGFCKSAVRMQNGDKKAFEKRKEFTDAWSQTGVLFLACSTHKCCFAGHSDINQIMTRVCVVESKGLKFRWPFLAKSHITQAKMKDNTYAFRCVFCVFSGEKSPVYQGPDAYLDHVATHRGNVGAVAAYKARCLYDRVADDNEEFDINLFPFPSDQTSSRRASEMLADDIMAMQLSAYGLKSDSVIDDSSTPWNEGLSDFHYKDEFGLGEIG